MRSSNLLMQYQSECLEALKSAAKVSKPFEKVLMDTLKLFMAIPGKVNFLQMGRYGEFSEQTYRNNFENETFDWFAFNEHLIRKVLNGRFLAIAVDPSFLLKSENSIQPFRSQLEKEGIRSGTMERLTLPSLISLDVRRLKSTKVVCLV